MPSAIWVEGEGLIVLGDELGFVVVDNDQAAGGGLQLLDQFPVAGARGMDVQRCGGVHGVGLALWWKSEANINQWLIYVNNLWLICSRQLRKRVDRHCDVNVVALCLQIISLL